MRKLILNQFMRRKKVSPKHDAKAATYSVLHLNTVTAFYNVTFGCINNPGSGNLSLVNLKKSKYLNLM